MDSDLFNAEELAITTELDKLRSPEQIRQWARQYGITQHPVVLQRLAEHRCYDCGKVYKHKKHLNMHVRAEHLGVTHTCRKCKKTFKYSSHKLHHEKSCGGQQDLHCPECGKLCATAHGLRRHIQTHMTPTKEIPTPKRKGEPGPSRIPTKRHKVETYNCRRCSEYFNNRRELYVHGMRTHFQRGAGLQRVPWGNDPAPWEREGEEIDHRLREVYDTNAPLILEQHNPGPVISTYNYPADNTITIHDVMRAIEDVYRHQQHAFRLNLTFGVILQHRETGAYRYFKPFDNSTIFDAPVYVSKLSDIHRLYQRLQTMDVMAELLRIRPDTKWVPELITNLRFTVYQTHYPLGKANTQLPKHLKNNHAVAPLDINRKTGKPYTDHLCAFRCLAMHKGYIEKNLETETRNLYQRWTQLKGNNPSFPGITYYDLPEFESIFQCNVEVYELHEEGEARSVYKTRGRYADTMYVNMHENHLSYIKNFALYAKKYQCKTCDRHFNQSQDLWRHQKTCTNKTKYVFPGGFFRPPQTIFEKLEEFGFHIPMCDRTYPWFAVFDFEAMLLKTEEANSEKLEWTQRHVPISVSICSNVTGYTEPHCIVEPDLEVLLKAMVTYLQDIATKAAKCAERKWGDIKKDIRRKLEPEEEMASQEEPQEEDKSLKNIYGQLCGYMTQLPVLGFNSAKYDLNLVKRKIARLLNLHDGENTFVIKNNNAYTCLSADTLKFLDVSQFLAAGTSYAQFLKAYGVDENKGHFPYDFLDDVSKLDVTELPPHQAFYSDLKQSNITREDYDYCQKVWHDEGMSTFKDFLIWYNNLDVGPFVKAVQRMQTFYFDRNIDLFKTAVSVPGIARRLLFKTAETAQANFALFDNKNSDLYHTFKNNVVGGPSIIFTRHHQAGKTRIRGKKKCRRIIGMDANALYLWAIGQQMPVGPFVRRKIETGFKPECRDKYMQAYHWMGWFNHTKQTNILHLLNHGKEKRIGKYPVDGYDPNTNTVYQFQGCYWHGHECHITKNIQNEKWKQERQQKFEKTKQTTEYSRAQGYKVVEMWECHFQQFCRDNPSIYKYIDTTRPQFYRKHKGKVSEEVMLKAVVNGELFGALEVDIKIPDQWAPNFEKKMSPSEYFSEMSPLFCTTDVPYDIIGAHMQEHVERFGLSKAPRRLLVGGTKGRQMLIATPLLKWYLEHGMVVTKIHQVVEFQSQDCFQDFVKQVSDARRAGDAHPDMGIIADTNKTIGNSAYGSLIMDKTKHRNVTYVQGERKACLAVNDPVFRKLECVEPEEEYYEVESAKTSTRLDLPIQLGYFILQYAKLRMLQYYYDFMDVYVGRANFEYCEMDTDSAYMAISGKNLDDVIRPELQENYHRGLKGFCTSMEVNADANLHWFPRTCCKDHAKYDKRTPGLFKLEYEGDEMIGLCSKTYIVRKTIVKKMSSTALIARRLLRHAMGINTTSRTRTTRLVHECKFSSKGISKRSVKCPLTTFRRVMRTGIAAEGVNRGIRAKDNTTFTYIQKRRGFSYFYCKRRVLSDGNHTVPLELELCPVKSDKTEDELDKENVAILASFLEESQEEGI